MLLFLFSCLKLKARRLLSNGKSFMLTGFLKSQVLVWLPVHFCPQEICFDALRVVSLWRLCPVRNWNTVSEQGNMKDLGFCHWSPKTATWSISSVVREEGRQESSAPQMSFRYHWRVTMETQDSLNKDSWILSPQFTDEEWISWFAKDYCKLEAMLGLVPKCSGNLPRELRWHLTLSGVGS